MEEKVLLKVEVESAIAIKKITEAKKEIAALKDEQKKLKDSGKELSAEYVKNEARIKSLNGTVRTQTRDLNNQEKAQTSAKGSIARLRAEVSLLSSRYNQLSEAERENSKEGKELKTVINDKTEALKKLESAVGDNRRNVGNYKSALDELGGSFGQLGVLMESYRGAQAKAIEANGGQLSGVKRITAGLGGLKTALVGLGIGAAIALIVGATKAWLNYNKELYESTRLTKQFTGLTGQELKTMRNEVKATADTFNVDFKETLQATNAVAKQFGISQSEAMDIVQKGFIAGADASGEFLEQLKEYPTQLQAAGLSAEESIAIITQNVSSGVFSDKGIDSIKEATLRLREMTPATREALEGIGISSNKLEQSLREGSINYFDAIQEVSGKLNELEEQSPEVGTAIADIFGGPGEDAGLNYLKTLADIDTNIDKVAQSAGEYGQIQADLLQSNTELENVLSEAFGSGNEGLQNMLASARLFVVDGLIKIIEGGVGVINFFRDLYNESAAFRGVIQFIKIGVENTFTLISAGIDSAIEGFKDFGKLIKAIFTGDFEAVGKIIKDGFKNQVDVYKKAGKEAAKNYKDGIAEVLNPKTKLPPIKIDIETATTSTKSTTAENKIVGETPEEREKRLKAEAKAREEAFKNRIEELKNEENQKELITLQSLEQRNISQIEFDKKTLDSEIENLNKRIELYKKFGKDTTRLELQLTEKKIEFANKAAEEIVDKTQKAFNETKALIAKDYADGLISRKEYNGKLLELEKARIEDEILLRKAAGEDVKELEQQLSVVIGQIRDKQADEDAKRIAAEKQAKEAIYANIFNTISSLSEASANAQMAFLEKQLAHGRISQKEFDEETAKIQVEAAERLKAVKTVEATISTFRGIAAALELPPPYSFILAALVGAQGFAQVANIQSTDVGSFEKGGMIEIGGKRHKNGGTKFVGSDGTKFEAEEGEMIGVINRKSVNVMKAMSAINEMTGGRSFFSQPTTFARDGGAIARSVGTKAEASINAKDIEKAVTRGMEKVTVVTKISEFNRVNNNTTKIKELSKL